MVLQIFFRLEKTNFYKFAYFKAPRPLYFQGNGKIFFVFPTNFPLIKAQGIAYF